MVPFSPGGATDLVARIIGERLGEMWGQTVVVENRAGASGAIGWEAVAKGDATGYQLLLSETSFATLAALKPQLPYDPRRDFVHIAQVARSPVVMAVNPVRGAKTVQEFVSAAKANPGKFNLGSSGVGSSTHLAGELFNSIAGIDVVHVPYRGVAAAIQDLVAGNVDTVFGSAASIQPFVAGGKLRALLLASTKRSEAFPGTPTSAEAGYPDMITTTWFGISAPAGLPPTVSAKIAQDVQQVLQDKAVQQKLVALGLEPVEPASVSYPQVVEQDIGLWERVVRGRSIKAD